MPSATSQRAVLTNHGRSSDYDAFKYLAVADFTQIGDRPLTCVLVRKMGKSGRRHSPLVRRVHVEGPLDDGGPLQAADDEGVGLGPLCLHQLTFCTQTQTDVSAPVGGASSERVTRVTEAPPTCYGEVVERVGQVRVLRLVLVADEGAVCLQQEVARPPVLDVLACKERRHLQVTGCHDT